MTVAGSAENTPAALRENSAVPRYKGDAREEARLLRKVVAMCGRLAALTSQDVGLADVVGLLSEGVGAEVALLDRTLEVLAWAGGGDPAGVLGKLRDNAGPSGPYTVLAAAARNRRALTVPVLTGAEESIIVAPISVGADVAGHLLVVGGRDHDLTEDTRLLVTEHAAVVCGVVLGRDLVVAAAAGRARQELFEGLLQPRDRDDGEVDRWARHLGFDPNRPYHVMAVTLVHDQQASALAAVESLLARLTHGAIVAGRPGEVVGIVPVKATGAAGTAEARALAATCASRIAERRIGVAAVGVGNPCHTASGIARSYAEASRALAATLRNGESGGVTAFADLGIHRLLLRMPDVGDLREFDEEVLGALIEEEESTGMDYLGTLSVYFHENASPRRAAQRLHVHPNTVSYRIRRIEEITCLSFDVQRDRLMAEVAIEILVGLGRV